MSYFFTDSTHSHPLFHPPSSLNPVLPQPEVEEEVEDSPLLTMFEQEERQRNEKLHENNDKPYLQFEITSDDGFHTRSDSLQKAWKTVTDKVQDARANSRMKQLSFVGEWILICFPIK